MGKIPAREASQTKTNSRRTQKAGYFRPGYAYLTCELGPTPSEEERLVRVDRLGGGRTVAIVSSTEVSPLKPLTEAIRGEVLVTVITKIPDGFLVDLPEDTLNSGPRVPVPQESVRFL